MIEIKCPFQRKIKYTGDIKGEICPDYYWCQVQLQLECCDLDECDFVQCNIEEYSSRQDFLADTQSDCDYKSQKYGLERGVVIELMPTKLDEPDYYEYSVKRETKDGDVYDKHSGIKNDAIYDKASFIYQPKLDMSLKELDSWVMSELDKLSSKPNVKLNRVIYWRFVERNNTLIKRDKEWFAKNIQTMRKIWSYVEILRTNNKIAEDWKVWVDSQNIKYKEKVMNKLVELIKNAGLWEQVVNAIGEFEPELMKEIEKISIVPNKNKIIIDDSKFDNNVEQEELIFNSSVQIPIAANYEYLIDLVECCKVELVESTNIQPSPFKENISDDKDMCKSVDSNIEVLSENITKKIVISEEIEKVEKVEKVEKLEKIEKVVVKEKKMSKSKKKQGIAKDGVEEPKEKKKRKSKKDIINKDEDKQNNLLEDKQNNLLEDKKNNLLEAEINDLLEEVKIPSKKSSIKEKPRVFKSIIIDISDEE
jgi:hypothetical protein